MRKGKNLKILLMPLLLLVPIVFLTTSCETTKATSQAEIDVVLKKIAPERPCKVQMEAVEFQEKDGGLWLSYEDYRALERNIISMKEYAAKLEVIITFWEDR